MRRGERLLLTTYLASAIEHNKVVQDLEKESHKDIIQRELVHPMFGIYDPVAREGQKSGKDCQLANLYIKNLKKAGHMERFDEEMDKIWWGEVTPGYDKIEIMRAIRSDFQRFGNTIDDLNHWADYQAVLRSDFIIAYIEKNVKTVGTIKEIHTAYLFNIPVMLLLPDDTVTDANSSLINMVRRSGGQVFSGQNCAKDLVKYLKETYKIWDN